MSEVSLRPDELEGRGDNQIPHGEVEIIDEGEPDHLDEVLAMAQIFLGRAAGGCSVRRGSLAICLVLGTLSAAAAPGGMLRKIRPTGN